jgi:biotin-dependent carboxylase-like uncharacterized protein
VGSRALVVLEPGPLTTVQDRGRPGWAHLGVPRAGALDAPAAALGNRLVGNAEDAAVLETTFGGLVVLVTAAMTLAVTGAEAPLAVDGRPVASRVPLTLRSGQQLSVGRPGEGVRSYLAVAGGLAVPPVLGSRSTDTLAWVGPEPVRAGAVLPVGAPAGPPRPADVTAVRRAARPVVLRVGAGPRPDWFAPDALDRLAASSYTVAPASNRVGLRLQGPLLTVVRLEEPASEGIVLGAVQVPPSGQPVVFLHDHPTTGGYPVLAVVDRADLALCAQLAPGDPVRFTSRR